ncbi:MAG: hypothetical protein NZL92_10360 [Gloeomargarita sp. SKYG116]|nr:hypothetical protein [Gloeomargarita sp. SKYG116]MDW8402084.1 hypothetical protein [Gloeomargarita sp. SKYGB_i_bin116]
MGRNWQTLLMLDVLVVVVGFVWFGVAVLGQAVWPGVWRAWLWLWQPLWQPAIGLLILGAIVTGVLNWWRTSGPGRAGHSKSDNTPT